MNKDGPQTGEGESSRFQKEEELLNDVVDVFGRLDREREQNLSQEHISPLPHLGTMSKLNKNESAHHNL